MFNEEYEMLENCGVNLDCDSEIIDMVKVVLTKNKELMPYVKTVAVSSDSDTIALFARWLLEGRTSNLSEFYNVDSQTRERLMLLTEKASIEASETQKFEEWKGAKLRHWGRIGQWPVALSLLSFKNLLEGYPDISKHDRNIFKRKAPCVFMMSRCPQIKDLLQYGIPHPFSTDSLNYQEKTLLLDSLLLVIERKLISIPGARIPKIVEDIEKWINFNTEHLSKPSSGEIATKVLRNFPPIELSHRQLQEMATFCEEAAHRLASERVLIDTQTEDSVTAWVKKMLERIPVPSDWRDAQAMYYETSSNVVRYRVWRQCFSIHLGYKPNSPLVKAGIAFRGHRFIDNLKPAPTFPSKMEVWDYFNPS